MHDYVRRVAILIVVCGPMMYSRVSANREELFGIDCVYVALLHFAGDDLDYHTFVSRYPPPAAKGYSLEQLGSIVKENGAFSTAIRTNRKLKDVVSEDQDIVVIAHLSVGHFVIVKIERGKERVIFDTQQAKEKTIPNSEFSGNFLIISAKPIVYTSSGGTYGWIIVFVLTGLTLCFIVWNFRSRRIRFMAAVVVLCFPGGCAKKKERSDFSLQQRFIQSTKIDLGELPFGTTRSVDVSLLNSTDQTFKITQMLSTCGCTSVSSRNIVLSPRSQSDIETVLDLTKIGQRSSRIAVAITSMSGETKWETVEIAWNCQSFVRLTPAVLRIEVMPGCSFESVVNVDSKESGKEIACAVKEDGIAFGELSSDARRLTVRGNAPIDFQDDVSEELEIECDGRKVATVYVLISPKCVVRSYPREIVVGEVEKGGTFTSTFVIQTDGVDIPDGCTFDFESDEAEVKIDWQIAQKKSGVFEVKGHIVRGNGTVAGRICVLDKGVRVMSVPYRMRIK